MNKLLWLFGVNFKISASTFGGGYVVIPLLRRSFVEGKNILSEDELLDMAAIAQSSPGAIAVNLAVLAGYRTAGAAGAIISAIGSILPPLITLSIVSLVYVAFRDNATIAAIMKGMEAGVAAIIADFVIDLSATVFRRKRALPSFAIIGAFFASVVCGVNVAIILVAAVGLAFIECLIGKWRKGGNADAVATVD